MGEKINLINKMILIKLKILIWMSIIKSLLSGLALIYLSGALVCPSDVLAGVINCVEMS